MRVCPRCDRVNQDDVDFCSCGEFLGWQAEPDVGAAAVTAVVAAPMPVAAPATDHVTVRVFRADQPDDAGEPEVSVPAGGRVTFVARVRNQSDIVDSFRLTVEGLPEEWWTMDPPTAYLLPSPREGHEEDVVIAVHPPRAPVAAAGPWRFDVVATSESHPTRAARASAVAVVEPFWQIAAAARPAVAHGRRRATLDGVVANQGNAPVTVGLAGADAEDRCRLDFGAGPIAVPPGQERARAVVVQPKRARWIGRPIEHRLDLVAMSVDDGLELAAPFPAAYRQRAWLPWWAPLLVLLLALVALVLWLVWPDRATVPNLKRSPSAFAAQKRLEKRGLTLNPRVRSSLRHHVRPGTVVDQAPAAGKTVAAGKAVTVVVAAGRDRVKVPKLARLRITSADQRLQRAGLTLGAVVPKLDPKGRVASQVPKPGVRRRRGSPVNVTLAKPRKPREKKKDDEVKKATDGGSTSPSVPTGAKPGGSAAKAAKTLDAAGLTPVIERRIDTARPGTLLATKPPAGKPAPPNGKVILVVSAGFPRLAYDSGRTVYVADGGDGRPATGVARHASLTPTGAWSGDGDRVAYVTAGRLYVARPRPAARPRRVALGHGRYASQAAFAPLSRRDVLVFADRGGAAGGGDALCWLVVGASRTSAPSCHALRGWRVTGLAWRPDGRELLVPVTGAGGFGVLRLATPVPFASDAHQWRGGDEVATPRRGSRGVRAAAFSPTGRRIALVTNLETSDFRVALVARDDLALEDPTVLPVPGCQVAWRPDGAELAVVQAGRSCAESVGGVVRVRPGDPRLLRTIVALGRSPSWQPVDLSSRPGP